MLDLRNIYIHILYETHIMKSQQAHLLYILRKRYRDVDYIY